MIILKNELNNHLNIATLKKLVCYEMFFLYCSIKSNFLYCPRFFILIQNLNVVRTPTETKQNLLYWILPHQDFVSFIKLLNISLDEYSPFPGPLKSVFNDGRWTEKNIPVLLSKMMIDVLLCVTADIQQSKFRFEEKVKLDCYLP